MIQNYRDPIPIQHVKEAAKVGARKSQQGCIGNAGRLNPKRFEIDTPGVGSYNMASFASLAVAKQSDFNQQDISYGIPLTARPAAVTQNSNRKTNASQSDLSPRDEPQGQGQNQNIKIN